LIYNPSYFYSAALFRRRQMIMNSTTTAITPEPNRIIVSISRFLSFFNVRLS
jgi:hypothetical protein